MRYETAIPSVLKGAALGAGRITTQRSAAALSATAALLGMHRRILDGDSVTRRNREVKRSASDRAEEESLPHPGAPTPVSGGAYRLSLGPVQGVAMGVFDPDRPASAPFPVGA